MERTQEKDSQQSGQIVRQKFRESEEIFQLLTEVLNEIHQLNYSVRFWKQVVRKYVQSVQTRKERLSKKVLNKSPDLYPINSYTFPSKKEKIKNGLILFVKHLKTRSNQKNIEEVLKNNKEVYLGFPKIPNFENREDLGVELKQYYPRLFGLGTRKPRHKLKKIIERFEEPYNINIIQGLPKIFVEYFPSMLNSIELFNPKDKIFHVHFCASIYNNLLIAKYVEHGAKLIWYQHGADNAEYTCKKGHLIQLSYVDEFRTWGWSTCAKEVPWKAYRLEEFRVNYLDFKNMVNIEFDLMICFPKISNENREYYKQRVEVLFENLDRVKYRNVLARPRRSNKIQSHASQLSFISDERVEITSGLVPMMEEMAKCRIVLQMTVPSTNFLECIYVDYPTIGILDNERPSELIIPYYEFFLENGVLHHNFESLVSHLNSIEIEDWWQNLSQKPVYQSFKKTFTRKV